MDNQMKNVIRLPGNAALRTAAAQWLVRLDRGSLTAEDRKELQAWLGENLEHRQVLSQMATLWGELDVVKILAELFPLPEDSRAQTASKPDQSTAETRKKPVKRLAVAAMLAFAVCAGFIVSQNPYWMPELFRPATDASVYATRLGEYSEIKLPDGSRLHLNTQSKARVEFTARERSVYLDEGEGYFQVAKNPDLPFVVYAGTGMVKAIGTAFSVRVSDGDAVDVTLAEGVVEVVADVDDYQDKNNRNGEVSGKANGAVATLDKKGERVNYRQSIQALSYIPVEMLERKLSWKAGKWMFKGETLAEVVAEANRYTDKEIRIVDPSIADLRVAGYFDLGDLEPLLEAVQSGLAIQVARRENGVIELSRADPVESGLTR